MKNPNKYTTRSMIKNILSVYDQNPEMGSTWYENAALEAKKLAAQGGLGKHSTIKAAGIITALSPQKSWSENLRIAEDNLARIRNGQELAGHTETCLSKVEAILSTESVEEILDILNGPKIKSFFLNIIGDTHEVTIDRHAIKIAMKGKEFKSLTLKRYQQLVHAYRIAASKRNVNPCVMQSVTWSIWRGKEN